MGFFKDLKDDFTKAIDELMPEDYDDTEDESDQMVNTLDLEDTAHIEEAENEMKEWLEGFMQENTTEDISEESLDKDIFDENITEDSSEDHLDENITEDSSEDHLDEDDLEEDKLEDIMEFDFADEEISLDDSTWDDDIHDEVHDEVNDEIYENMIEEEITQKGLEDEVEDMGEKVNLKVEEIEVIDDVNADDFDENVDLDLLDALNAEEEQDDSKMKPEPKVRAASVANGDEVTVISKGTTINGSISSDGSLDIMGSITGDVECLGKLSITGKIVGNSTAAEVYINTERLEGSINSEGSVKVGLGTVIVGDIIATSGVIAGAVKGEIDINGPIVIDSTAIIKGNIKAKSVQINNGAVVEGFCSLSYSDVDLDNVFE